MIFIHNPPPRRGGWAGRTRLSISTVKLHATLNHNFCSNFKPKKEMLEGVFKLASEYLKILAILASTSIVACHNQSGSVKKIS